MEKGRKKIIYHIFFIYFIIYFCWCQQNSIVTKTLNYIYGCYVAGIYLIPNLEWFEAEEDKVKMAQSKHTSYPLTAPMI